MMMFSLLLAIIFQTAEPPLAVAATLKIAATVNGTALGPKTVVEPGDQVILRVTTTAKKVTWNFKELPTEVKTFASDSSKTVCVWAKLPKNVSKITYTFRASIPDGLDGVAEDIFVLTLQAAQPPPGPKPDPPKPTDANPFDDLAKRVLIIYESADVLPSAQQAIITGAAVREALEKKTSLGPDGKTREYRIFDQNLDLSGEAPVWYKAMNRPRSKVPWILIGNLGIGYEGPLPANQNEALELLKKYLGDD